MGIQLNIRAALLLLLSAILVADDFPMTADHLVTGPNSRILLTNTADQPITSWALAITTPTVAGQHREQWTVDGYLSEVTHGLPGAANPLERLLPGEVREVPLDPVAKGATVEIVMVVLDDGTAIGDEQSIVSIFERRAKERDALGAVARTFEEVLSTQRGTAALGPLRQRLIALVERDPSVPCRAALQAVETYQRNAAGATPDDIEQSLRAYAAFVAREHELATKHAQRKNP
jgi:hypothetical protein